MLTANEKLIISVRNNSTQIFEEHLFLHRYTVSITISENSGIPQMISWSYFESATYNRPLVLPTREVVRAKSRGLKIKVN